MNTNAYIEMNGYLYRAEADSINGRYQGTIDFMRVSDFQKTFVPSVRVTLTGDFPTLAAAKAAAEAEGYRRASEGDVIFD